MQLVVKSLLFAILLSFGFASSAASAGRDAEQFAGGLLQQTAAILRDASGGEAVRGDRLHGLVLQNLDARNTALFALGNYQRQVDPQGLNDYVAAFTDYITAVYEARLRSFRAFDFKIVTSTDAGHGDITVVTQAVPVFGQRGGSPIFIWLRLSSASGQYKIVDVQIAGMWVSIFAREKFAAILSQNRADVHALTSYLTGQAMQIRGNNGQVASR